MHNGVLTLAPYLHILPPSIQIPHMKNFMPGISGGLGMVRCFICSSHNCHHLHVLNFLALAVLSLNDALHTLSIRNLFISLASQTFTLLLSLEMNSSLFIALLLVLQIMLHVGGQALTS